MNNGNHAGARRHIRFIRSEKDFSIVFGDHQRARRSRNYSLHRGRLPSGLL